MKRNVKLYDLKNTFNIIIQGSVINADTQKILSQMDVFADVPLHVNILDRSKPLRSLTDLQRASSITSMHSRGHATHEALNLSTLSPITYILQINLEGMD